MQCVLARTSPRDRTEALARRRAPARRAARPTRGKARPAMRRLRIGILDLVTKAPTRSLYARVIHANLASIMPQVLGVWCERGRPRRPFVCYTGFEDLLTSSPRTSTCCSSARSPRRPSSPTRSARCSGPGARHVLGGPHARCYPAGRARSTSTTCWASRTRRRPGRGAARTCAPHRPLGRCSAPTRSRGVLPGVRERWKFIEPTLAKARRLKIVPMLGSLGCPYTCSSASTPSGPYQPLNFRADARGPAASWRKAEAAAGGLARPELRGAVRRATWTPSRRRVPPGGSTSSPRAACRCCPSRAWCV